MPYFPLPDATVLYTLLTLFLLALLFLLWAYRRERQHRRRPYFRTPTDYAGVSLEALPKPRYSVALIGDIGDINAVSDDPLMQLLGKWMDHQGETGAVVLLGDNIYPIGLPPETHWRFPAAEQKLANQVAFFRQHTGRVIYLSGNHDWNKARPDGLTFLLRQQEFVIEHLQKEDSYLPLDGCPGPVALELAPGLRLVVINTQWWVQRGPRPIGRQYSCTVDSPDDFFRQLQELLEQYRHEQVIVAAHHPLYSNALHGGQFPLKQHIFPLTAAHKRFYIPLPVAGSLYPAYRKLFGAYEDMSHPRYRRMRRKLLRVFRNFNNLIYAAGHDHNLQYFPVRGNHYVVSGSGSKTDYVRPGGKAAFTHENRGFFVVDYYEDGSVWLRTVETPLNPDQGEVVFSRRLI